MGKWDLEWLIEQAIKKDPNSPFARNILRNQSNKLTKEKFPYSQPYRNWTEGADTKRMLDEQMSLDQKRWAKQSVDRDMILGREAPNLKVYQKIDTGATSVLPEGTIKFQDLNPLTTETPYGTTQVNLGQNTKAVDKAKDVAKYTPSDVRRIPSNLRWNEGLGRWTAPRNSGRLMRANLELRNQPTQIQKPIADEVGDGIPGFASSWGGKTYGNMDSWAAATNLGTDKALNLSSLGAPAAATKFAAGMSSPNYIASAFSPTAASLGQAAGQTALTTGGMTGITSGASAAGMAKGPLFSLGINAAKAILARVLAGEVAIHHKPYYQHGIGQQDDPRTTFYTGGSWR